MADQAKGKGIAPKRATNPADSGQSSRPLLPIRTLLEDKEDGEDYGEVIQVLKQHLKSYRRVIASQSRDIKTLLLSLNTLKASIKDSVGAIKNISSTLASLTNSSNAATTGKTSCSPRFNPFSGTIDLDSPLYPHRKEPYLGPAVNSATSNLDPPIDIGSKEGFKDTITSSIVKELSKKAYTILDDKNPDISNTYSNSDQAILLILLRNSLSSSPRAAISWIYIPSKAFKLLVRQYSRPIESKKEDVYNEFHALTFSTYRKGLLAFNIEFNGYLTKLTIAKIDIDPSLILNQYFKALESKFPSWASFILGSHNLAVEEEEEESDSSSNSNHISNSKERPAGIGSIILEVLSRKAPPTYTKLVLDTVLYLPNININIVSRVRYYNLGGYLIKETLYGGDRRYIAVLDFKKSGFFLNVKGSSKPILHINFAFPLGLTSYNTTKSIELQCNKIVVEIPSNSIRKEDYRPIIEDAIVSEAIEPEKRYKLRNSPAKGTTLEGIGPSLRGKRPYRPYLNSTKDYSIYFSYNGNIVADLGPKLSNSSNTTTKLSKDFHSKEGPRPLTTTSTTIVDSRNSKGSSRTSIINSSLVPIGFSDSDFAGDKATSKSTYGYLYKLAGGPISWKTKRATTIALSTLEAETDGLTEAIREVQWIIGLFSELHRPIDYPITLYGDNQGSITVANDPALYARTKYTLLKFRYVREQVKAKIVTIIYLNTKFNSTGYFTAL
ncbi:hypothetical protein P8C59_000234 [Phyllachora maydis]|uniref:Reverse transcriptase Ty1/copia-type domain-containing protein n=1 Tax=Phyllachora maydis TaxID=1825666 RepID=A0AAD9HWY4_9PEZI|nr:hypothetical protein P8C59_000234 [Phyllachora maydis]